MNPKASLAAFMGLALVLANLWKTGAIGPSGLGAVNWKNVGIEMGGVVVATFVANVSDDAANLVLVVFLILWLLFLMHTFTSSKTTTTTTASPAKPAATAQKGAKVA